ncbi:hypothetical protein ADICEAN_03998 [Cesiribacter andamanensis AMV16]|uniref:Uncharacterized protein n=1 Tax=Cesiribacter andamanensis AMV16 TaxID=1279009 RepID=M7NQV0_9BACT|nr:hypothetical protein ADICEAN_03998 [Cesiribacter andamanensis AMV16]
MLRLLALLVKYLDLVNDLGRQVAQGSGGIIAKKFPPVYQHPPHLLALGLYLPALHHHARQFFDQVFGIGIRVGLKRAGGVLGGIALLDGQGLLAHNLHAF